MRIYTNTFEAMKETARDLVEMGIDVKTHSMQDKIIDGDADYNTKELQGYGFKIADWAWDPDDVKDAIMYIVNDREELDRIWSYIHQEHEDRTGGRGMNPGNAYKHRREIWDEFLHEDNDGQSRFAYTYSERFAPQIMHQLDRLDQDPGSRQAIITMHANLIGTGNYLTGGVPVEMGTDFVNAGGNGRIPCSMYYQVMVRRERVDLIYTMRSCDLLTHFPVDITLALMLQRWFAKGLNREPGTFTYFAGSLHAYAKDMKKRGEF